MAQDLKINILAQDKTRQAFTGIQGKLASLKNAVFSVKGALAGIGAGFVIKSFVDTGRSVEDLQVRLKQLFGSTREGAKAFDVMSNFAAKVPFSLEQIQAASGNLAVVAGDADRLSKILEITGNVAAVTGLDFTTTAEQIQRSFAGGIASADIFRERGVRDLLGFSAGATVSAEETIEAFERVFGKQGRFGKATDELANTFTGTLSMLGDKLFNFKRTVAGEGFFDELKKEFSSLNMFIEQNSEQFETIGRAISGVLTIAVKGFAMAIRGVAKAVGVVKDAYVGFINILNKIPFVNIEIEKTQQAVNDSLEDYEDQAVRNYRLNQKTNNSLIKQKDTLQEIVKLLDKDMKKITDVASNVSRVLQMGIDGFSKGIAESIILGKELNVTMKDLARTLAVEVLSTLIKIVAQKAVMYSIDKASAMIQSKTGSAGGTGLSGIFKSVLGVFGRASGGTVSKDKPYIVGEKGAELFIPNSTGQIAQSARGMGSGQTTVNFNINTLDARGFDELLVRNRGTITQIINSAVNERGAKSLI